MPHILVITLYRLRFTIPLGALQSFPYVSYNLYLTHGYLLGTCIPTLRWREGIKLNRTLRFIHTLLSWVRGGESIKRSPFERVCIITMHD